MIEAKLKLDVDEILKTAAWVAECQIHDNPVFESLVEDVKKELYKEMEYAMRTALERVSEFNLVAK